MTQFRKKPVVVLAHQYFAVAEPATRPDWLAAAFANGAVFVREGQTIVKAMQGGERIAEDGDWIIQGARNDLYPVRNDIFVATYEAVEG